VPDQFVDVGLVLAGVGYKKLSHTHSLTGRRCFQGQDAPTAPCSNLESHVKSQLAVAVRARRRHDSTVRVARTAVKCNGIRFVAFYFGTVLPPEVVPIIRGGHAKASAPVSTGLGVRLFTSVTTRELPPGDVSR